jgi:ABC-type transporter Mla maintaining outer membrane lipid asymmetry ATPase subunit MlaF
MSCKVELRDIYFKRGENAILNGVNLTVEPGGVVVLGGRGGQGKSTLLEICAGLLKPASGSVLWNGKDITEMHKYDLYNARKSIGYVFQIHALISNHNVFDNIALPLKCGTTMNSGQIREKVWAQMEELGISREIEKKLPETLAAAELKSVAVARALINEPKLVLLDEPLNSIDPFTADTIINALHKRWKNGGMSIIMTAHSMGAWPELGAGRFLIKDGRLEPASEAFATVSGFKHHQRYIYAK